MEFYIHEKHTPSSNPIIEKRYDVVVVGGGMSGICAAIASARQGASTAIIQDRSVFGGNASSEIKMHVCGASCHWGKKDASETGILMELQLENKYLNDSHNYSIWDGVLWSKVLNTKNLDCFLNTTMYQVHSDGSEIESIDCYQMTTESKYKFYSEIFIDATGLGSLSCYAGAEFRIGKDGQEEFLEKNAPSESTGETMGNTILFCAYDTGSPVRFIKPDWAYTYDEESFKHRFHGNVTVRHTADDVVVLKPDDDYDTQSGELVEKYDVQSGYWWIELGGDYNDIIKDSEHIRWELYKTVYGIWDHIKNRGVHGAENYELLWIGNLPGIRESRRVMGDYVLVEEDILNNHVFEDGVAYGGWPMDDHTAGGFLATDKSPSIVRSFRGLYSIPYRCYYSNNIKNLMMCGRIISASKIAMSSTRIMGTCAIGGQAVGTAAAMATKRKCTPKEYGKLYVQELKQELLKNDCYLMGAKNLDEKDLARKSKVQATSQKLGFEAEKVINGYSRNLDDENNLWISEGIHDTGESLTFKLQSVYKINEVRITFDPNLNQEHCISVSKSFIDKEPIGVPKELVKNYTVFIKHKGKIILQRPIKFNYQRLNVIDFETPIEGDEVCICIHETHGVADARVFEVRIY